MERFEGFDFLHLVNDLPLEEREILSAVREMVDQEIIPKAPRWFESGYFPREIIPLLAEMGLLGASLHGYGCAALGPRAYGIIMQELERGDSGIRSFVSVQSSLAMYAIYRWGTDAQKQRYLPLMQQGKLIGCFGLTEPDYGSNPAGMKTHVIPDGKDYILTGTKMWITNGEMADLAIVWGKNPNGEVMGFIVEKGTSGFEARPIERKYSLRISVTSELIFQDCRVPKENVLEVKGLKGPLSCLNEARFGITWGAVGAMSACLEEALRYAKTRVQFSKPIAGYQFVQSKLVWCFTELTKAQALSFRLAELKESGRITPQQISMGKMNNVSKALEVARICRDILGASGVTLDYQVGRHLLNLESVNTYEGTEDIHKLILGAWLTGMEAFHS